MLNYIMQILISQREIDRKTVINRCQRVRCQYGWLLLVKATRISGLICSCMKQVISTGLHIVMLLHSQTARKALCFRSDLNGGCESTPLRMPVSTDLMRASAFAECLVSESLKQSALTTCARSSMAPELDSFLNICIK